MLRLEEGALVGSWEMRAELADRIAGIEVVASSGAALVLPSAAAVLGLQLRGRVRGLALAGVTGIQSVARTYAYEPDTVSILVRF